MVRLAGIDCGSNSLKLLIADVSGGGQVERLDFRAFHTRIGEGITATGTIPLDATEHVIQIIEECTSMARHDGVIHMAMVATEFARVAKNRDWFVNRVAAGTGLVPRVLSGRDEARLVYLGVASDFADERQPLLIFNIGSRSTELSVGPRSAVDDVDSVPIGAATLTEGLSDNTSTISDDEFATLLASASRALAPVISRMRLTPTVALVGSGGTVVDLALVARHDAARDFDSVHLHTLSLQEVEGVASLVRKMSLREREKLAGMDRQRAETSVGGAAILVQLLSELRADKLTVSIRGLADGVVVDLQRHAETRSGAPFN